MSTTNNHTTRSGYYAKERRQLDIIMERLRALGDPSHTPVNSGISTDSTPAASPTEAEPLEETLAVCVADLKTEDVRWLWPKRIPQGKLTVIDGDPGVGKSLLTMTIAAHVSQGRQFPDGSDCPMGDVIVLSAEDGPADTIRPRLEAAGADLKRVHVITGIPDARGGERLPDIQRDAALIEAEVLRLKAAVVIIDPLNAYIGGQTNTWNDQQVRRALAPFVAMALRTGVTLIVVRHLTKDEDRKALYRGGGSIAFIAAARAAFVVAPDPEDPEARILACTKQNLAPLPAPLAFTIDTETTAPRLIWEGESNYTADQLLGPTKRERDSACDRAIDFLQIMLSAGPKPAEELTERARGTGISERTLKRAKAKLGVGAEHIGFGEGSRWMWHLP